MRRFLEFLWPTLVLGILLLLGNLRWVKADDLRYSGRLRPNDYLMGSQEEHRDPVFDKFRTVDLSASIGVGSDCGRIDVKSTLRSSLQNILDSKYFGDMGRDILAASPMLLTCYFSPTWCAILKHSQVNAHWLSNMRLDQCSLVDKYVDSRVEDYYQERQSCVRQAIEANGGNLESAMESCRGNNMWQADLVDWAGSPSGQKTSSNRLIDSSAKWAGMNDAESQGSLNLVKALVGDTVISKGGVSVEYGPRQTLLTPRTYLQSLEKVTYDRLCNGLIKRVNDSGGKVSLDRLIENKEILEVGVAGERPLIDRQTLRSLGAMPYRQQTLACRKLSDAVSMTVFSQDVNRSLDVLSTLAQNPNLPPHRKQEIETKRKMLKDQVELTLELLRERNEPINAVLAQINAEGGRLQTENVDHQLTTESNQERESKNTGYFFDCSDGVLCSEQMGR